MAGRQTRETRETRETEVPLLTEKAVSPISEIVFIFCSTGERRAVMGGHL